MDTILITGGKGLVGQHYPKLSKKTKYYRKIYIFISKRW